jgi:hypothetical protein
MALARQTFQLVVKFRVLIAVLVLLVGCSAQLAHGQSQFALANGLNGRVYDALGQPLAGANYLVELWGGAEPNSLTPALSTYELTRIIIPFDTGGYFRDRELDGGGYSTIFSVPPGLPVWLQVRAWEAGFGGTYEAVAALGIGGYGASPLFQGVGTYPYQLGSVPASLIGLQSFSLLPVVPEPGTWALALLGLACFASWRWLGKRPNSS